MNAHEQAQLEEAQQLARQALTLLQNLVTFGEFRGLHSPEYKEKAKELLRSDARMRFGRLHGFY